jgi:hypothetical protein
MEYTLKERFVLKPRNATFATHLLEALCCEQRFDNNAIKNKTISLTVIVLLFFPFFDELSS